MNYLERSIARVSRSTQLEQAHTDSLIVVDDCNDIVAPLVDYFQYIYKKVLGYNDPLEAKEQILRISEPTLIVSDYQMPGMNGAELARQTFEHRQKHQSPFIIHSANTDQIKMAEVDELIRLGIIDESYIKPSENIIAIIESYHQDPREASTPARLI